MGILPKCFGFSGSKHSSSSLHQNQYSTQIEELCHRFSLAQIRKSTNNFDKSRITGRGGYCVVYKGRIYIQGVAKEVAIKRTGLKYGPQGITLFNTEIELLCQLHHQNLVSLLGFCKEKDEYILVYEYVPNRSLAYYLFENTGEPLPWKKRIEICIGAARGLHYLHTGAKRTIFHRDVKPNNILLDHNWIPKLSAFGLSLKGPLSMSKPRPLTRVQIAGTPEYIAPECFISNISTEGCFLSNVLTEKCDVFSFGMVLLVVVCARDPISIFRKMEQVKYHDVSQRGSDREHLKGPSLENLASQIYNLAQKGMADDIVDHFLMGKIAPECWKVFMDIAERCLLFEPNERPAMGEVEVELEHALALQEEADHTNPSGDYSLLSTVTTPQPEHAK